jgi:putative peptidoglycan lipid II flippase
MADSGTVARRAGLVALGTFLSRILGMVREMVVAASFTVAQTDAFFIAYTIPNTLRMLLGEGAISNAFVPVFSAVRAERGEARAQAFYVRFSGVLIVLLSLASVAGVLSAPVLSLLYAAGLADEPERFALVVSLTRWLFPVLALAGIAALGAGILQIKGRFAVASLSPAAVNVAMIAAPFTLLPLTNALGLPAISALAFGALIGGVLQILVQLPALQRIDALAKPRVDFRDPDVRRALALIAPLTLGFGVYQLNMLFSRLFTSFLPDGSLSYLNYGQRVIEIPQGMFALALAAAALPTLARLRSEQKHEELLALFHYALRLTLFIAIPASVLLFVLAEPTAATLLGRGAFGPHQIRETARSLAVQALGVWAVAAVRAVIPMFAAHEDTRTQVKASALNLVVFLALSASLMRALDHVAIALANSLAAAVQLMALLWALRSKLGRLGLSAIAKSALKVLIASLIMGVAASWAQRLISWTQASELTRMAAFLTLLVFSAVVFLTAATLLRARELAELRSAVRRRAQRGT